MSGRVPGVVISFVSMRSGRGCYEEGNLVCVLLSTRDWGHDGRE